MIKTIVLIDAKEEQAAAGQQLGFVAVSRANKIIQLV